MKISKFPKGDSKCICDNCRNKTAIKLIEMNTVSVWLCCDCSKELLELIKKQLCSTNKLSTQEVRHE